jgi:hypothetical protein
MQSIANALSDPVARGWYLAFCFALMVLPMIALSAWYHLGIRRTAGGRALMKRQTGNPARSSITGAVRSTAEAGRMARDIAAGKYGAEVRAMQNRTYVIVALWLVANVVAFGILFWADEINRPAPL